MNHDFHMNSIPFGHNQIRKWTVFFVVAFGMLGVATLMAQVSNVLREAKLIMESCDYVGSNFRYRVSDVRLSGKDLLFNLRVISEYTGDLSMSVPLDFVDISTTKNGVVFVCRNRSSCAKSGTKMVPSVTVGACEGMEPKLESILKGLR